MITTANNSYIIQNSHFVNLNYSLQKAKMLSAVENYVNDSE